MAEENLSRSAGPPRMSTGVMIAKVPWNMQNTVSGIVPDSVPVPSPISITCDRPPMNGLPFVKASE